MWLYRVVIGIARAMAPLVRGDSKLARALAGRAHAHEVLVAWGRGIRDPARPTVWFHAPSVGEGLQAEAVVRALRERRPEIQVVFTFFSPSAESLARSFPSDVSAYLPWDLREPMRGVLGAVSPDALVFTKTEVWPVLTREATRRGVPVGMVAATVSDRSTRMRWSARMLLRETWGRLSFVTAVGESDRARLVEMGVDPGVLSVDGDPAIDSAVARIQGGNLGAPWFESLRKGKRPVVVAGSTWPADEAVLVPAFAQLRSEVADGTIGGCASRAH